MRNEISALDKRSSAPSSVALAQPVDASRNESVRRNSAAGVATAPTLRSLPEDLMSRIVWHLPVPDMCAIEQTCKSYKAIMAPCHKPYLALRQGMDGLVAGLRHPSMEDTWLFSFDKSDKVSSDKGSDGAFRPEALKRSLPSAADHKQRILQTRQLLARLDHWQSELPHHVFTDTADTLFDNILYWLKSTTFMFAQQQAALPELPVADDLVTVIVELCAAVTRWRPCRNAAVIAELAQLQLGKTIDEVVNRFFQESAPAVQAAILTAFSHSRTSSNVWYSPRNRHVLAGKWFAHNSIDGQRKLAITRHFIEVFRQSGPHAANRAVTSQLSDFMAHQYQRMLEILFSFTKDQHDRTALDIELLQVSIPWFCARLAQEQNDRLHLFPFTAMNVAGLIYLVVNKANKFPESERAEILFLAHACRVIYKARDLAGDIMIDVLEKAQEAAFPEPQVKLRAMRGLLEQQILSSTERRRLQNLVLNLPAFMQEELGQLIAKNRDRYHQSKRRHQKD